MTESTVTNYVIRYNSKKGNMTSLFRVLGRRLITSRDKPISLVPVHWQGLQYDTNNVLVTNFTHVCRQFHEE